MPLNSIGYDGTVNEAGMARLLSLLGQPHTVSSRSAFAASQISGLRSIRIAAAADEYAYSGGVAVNNTTAIDLPIPGPASGAGQFFLVVLRRTFDSNTNSVEVLKGDLTGANPLAVPTSYPNDFQSRVGIQVDQPLYWAWTNPNNLAVQLVDLRVLSPATPRRGTTSQRTSFFGGDPSFTPARVARQGAVWFNTDTNLDEVYMAAYDATTNPGGLNTPGASPGWYSVGNNGTPVVSDSSFTGYLDTPPGKNTTVDYIDFDLSQGRFVEVESYMSWYAPGNSAGTLFASLDSLSSANALKTQHVHSNGGPVKYGPVWLRYKLWMPAGKHRINIVFSSEAPSAANGKIRTASTAWGAAR